MKGVILAGGTGSRLHPLTKVTNKHLLPVYDKPMIYYPLDTLKACGIMDILIISGKGHAGHFLNLLESGRELGVRLSYGVQEEAGGIAQALSLAEDFADQQPIAVILGDNIYERPSEVADAVQEYSKTNAGAMVLLKEVIDPQRFGVAEVQGSVVVSIQEKPVQPKSNMAVTGFYLYDGQVFDIIRTLKPSGRGELEITDVNNHYLSKGQLSFSVMKGQWTDAGTFASLYRASTLVAQQRQQ